ncbi:hypothetical protein [Brevibacterium casei]|nr:hypothetical protein [Brevibacterium casei]
MDFGEVFQAGGELLGWWFETFRSSRVVTEPGNGVDDLDVGNYDI